CVSEKITLPSQSAWSNSWKETVPQLGSGFPAHSVPVPNTPFALATSLIVTCCAVSTVVSLGLAVLVSLGSLHLGSNGLWLASARPVEPSLFPPVCASNSSAVQW